MSDKVLEVAEGSRLRELYPLLDEAVLACAEWAVEGDFTPDVYAKALSGVCRVWSVSGDNGVAVCTSEQGILYVNHLYIRVGAPRGLMQKVAEELIDLAREYGMLEVRFKTQRPAGMKRALGELGFAPRAMEFQMVLADRGE